MRNIAVTCNLIGRIDDNDPFAELGGQNARAFAKQCRFPNAGTAQKQTAFAGLNNVTKNVDRAKNRPADTAGQTDDDVAPIPNGRNAMQRPLDAGAIVECK
jgi:hypothetical protein